MLSCRDHSESWTDHLHLSGEKVKKVTQKNVEVGATSSGFSEKFLKHFTNITILSVNIASSVIILTTNKYKHFLHVMQQERCVESGK